MANPSPAAIAAIQARVAVVSAWTKADAQVLADLQADTTANPVPQASAPRPFTAADLIGACSAANRPNLAGPLNGAAAALIVAQDGPHLAAGLDALAALGAITTTDAAAMKAIVQATMPDPTYVALVPQIQVTLGRPIDLADVAAGRPQGS